jgi:exopolyphosphatase/guanosine-5'-triphosphate,3'-diphosphate pyrophosphatase
METMAAIDIGSNAIRLLIGERDQHGDIHIVKKMREPVRLGKDVFAEGIISPKTREKAIEVFVRFSEILKSHRVTKVRAVATSALREAKDRDSFVQEVKKASGIRIDVIDGIEEGRLIYSAVAHRMNLSDRVGLLIDIGGGSVELTINNRGKCVATQTFRLGTVRMLQLMEQRGFKEKHLRALIEEQLGPVEDFLKAKAGNLQFDMAIGTGGNFECLGKLRVALLHKNSIFSMTLDELENLSQHLQTMSVKERIQFLRLRPDRADVVIPAALLTHSLMSMAGIDVLTIPYVGLRNGILAELGARPSLTAAK